MLENLFINILEISITSAAAIAVILLISGLSENKFRKKWRYWVWAFLAVYLIFPFKIDFPDAPIKMEIPPHEMVITQKVEVPEYSVPMEPSTENIVPGTFEEDIPVSVPDSENIAGTHTVEEEKKIYVYPVIYVAAVIWATGAVIVCGWNIAMYIRFTTRSHPWNREVIDEDVIELFEELKAEMRIPKRVKLYENRLIKSPMMVGYFRPRVLLPAEALLPGEYEFVLRHELTHCRRGDIWYKFIMMLAASVHWFNPLVGRMCHYAENDMEITCDAAVVKAMAGDRRQEYCATILNIMRRGQNSPLLLSTSFYGGAKILKKRFSAVLEPRAHRGVALFIIAVLIIAISGTLVACKTVEVPKAEEPVIDEQQEEIVPTIEEIAEEEAEKLISGIYINKFNEFAEEDALDGMNFTKEAKKVIEDIESGKTPLFSGTEKMKNRGTSLKLSKKEAVTFEKAVEFVFGIDFSYIPSDKTEEVESSHIIKIGYDTEKEEFTKILIFGYNWFENGKDKPEVAGADENGNFPAISAADWDRWVTYNGEPDSVKPTEEIPSITENKKMMENLKREYPEIDDWKVVYEKKDYVLKNTYDPYTYSYRGVYLPNWFVLFETEQSEEFDRLFVMCSEDYSVNTQGENFVPCKNSFYSAAEAFEKDIKVGNMKNAVTLSNRFFPNDAMLGGIWFPEKNKMIFFGQDMKAYAIEGINEPLYVNRTYDAFGPGRKDLAGEELEVPFGREKDLFLEIDVSAEKNQEKGSIAYYDYETKTVDIYENCVEEGLFEYPQIYYVDSEVVMIETEGIFSFYKAAPHNTITEAFSQFGGSGKGLCEGKIADIYYLATIDKTKGGRYMFFYTEEEKEEYNICTFDKNGNILSNLGTGLDANGVIKNLQYKSGVAYFTYVEDAENAFGEGINYAVDARPNGKQELEANAW